MIKITLIIFFLSYYFLPVHAGTESVDSVVKAQVSLDSLVALNDKALGFKNKGSLTKAKQIYPIVLQGISDLLGKSSQPYIDVSVNYTRLLNEIGDTYHSIKILKSLDSLISASALKLDMESELLLHYSKGEAYLYQGQAVDALQHFNFINEFYENNTNAIDNAIYSNTLSCIAECYEIENDFLKSKNYFNKAIDFAANFQSVSHRINLENNFLEMSIKSDSLVLGWEIWNSIEAELVDSLNNVIEYVAYFNYLKLCESTDYKIDLGYAKKGLKLYEEVMDDVLANLSERQLNSFAKRKFKNFQDALRILRNCRDSEVIDLLYRCHQKSKDIVNRYHLHDLSEKKSMLNFERAEDIFLDFFEIVVQDSLIQYGFFEIKDSLVSIDVLKFQYIKSQPFISAEFQKYWDQICDKYMSEKVIRVSPFGKLHQFNFQTYHLNSTRYLISEEYSKSQLDSVKALAIGGLFYSEEEAMVYADREMNNYRSQNFSFLPFSKKEIDFLELQMENSSKYISESINGYRALEPLVSDLLNLNDHDIIHFATHGFFDDNIEYSEYNDGFYKSGLVLSNPKIDKNSIEDNILHGYEVEKLNLENTSLLFLSACRSGIQEINFGDNLYGLEEAFIRAGVKNIISTSDVISDAISYEFSKQFYLQFFDKKESLYWSYRHALNSIYREYGLDEAVKFKFKGNGNIRLKKESNKLTVLLLLIFFLATGVYLLNIQNIKRKINSIFKKQMV